MCEFKQTYISEKTFVLLCPLLLTVVIFVSFTDVFLPFLIVFQGPVIYAQLDHSGSKNSFHKMEPVVYADIRKN